VKPDIIATGGASDRCVKIWDLESYLSMKKDDSNMSSNLNTATSRGESIDGSTESDPSRYVILLRRRVQVPDHLCSHWICLLVVRQSTKHTWSQ
jgi:hypothetical protein